MGSRQRWLGVVIGAGAVVLIGVCALAMAGAFLLGRAGAFPLPVGVFDPQASGTPTLAPVPLPPQPTPTPAVGVWTTTSDQSTGYGFNVDSNNWMLQWACVPESDPHGTLAVRFVMGDGQVMEDTGLQACNGTVRSFTLSNAGAITAEFCEDDDFTTTPQPSGPPTINCKDGAVKWTVNSPNPSTGNVGWG